MFPFWYRVARLIAWLFGRDRTSYRSFAHDVLKVDFLRRPFRRGPRLGLYERDIAVRSYVIPKRGVVPTSVVEADELLVPTFEIAANPTIRFADLYGVDGRARKFAMFRGAEESLDRQQDVEVLKCLNIAIQRDHTVYVTRDLFAPKHLMIVVTKIREHECPMGNILIHPDALSLMKSWVTPLLVWNSPRKARRTGICATFDKVPIRESTLVTRSAIYVLAAPEYVGVIPVDTKRRVLPCHDYKRLRLGWVVWQNQGYSVVNDYAIGAVRIDDIVATMIDDGLLPRDPGPALRSKLRFVDEAMETMVTIEEGDLAEDAAHD